MTLLLLSAALIAATPISLDVVRRESRDNTQARVAELERMRAAEQVRISRAEVLPHLAFNAGTLALYDTRDLPRTVGSFGLSASLSQLLYDGGRWWDQIAQSGALADAQAGQVQEQRLASELEGVRRFYDLYLAQEALRVLEAHARRSEEQLDRARSLFEAGRGQKSDAYAAEVNLGNDRLAVERQRARIIAAQGALAVWLARPGADALIAETPSALAGSTAEVTAAADPRSFAVPPSVEDALRSARESRPLLRAVSARVRAAERGIDIASSAYWPAVFAVASGGRQSLQLAPFFTDYSRQNYVQAGLNLQWDLFNGGATPARVQQAEISRRRAELELRQAERELDAEVRSSVVQLRSQLEITGIARANVHAARSGLELAEGRFQAGVGSTLEVRDAQLKLTQAELSLLESRIDAEVARAALDRVLGREGAAR